MNKKQILSIGLIVSLIATAVVAMEKGALEVVTSADLLFRNFFAGFEGQQRVNSGQEYMASIHSIHKSGKMLRLKSKGYEFLGVFDMLNIGSIIQVSMFVNKDTEDYAKLLPLLRNDIQDPNRLIGNFTITSQERLEDAFKRYYKFEK